MKRIRERITAACAAVCLLCTFGCAKTDARPLLWYQDALRSATIAGPDGIWRVAPAADGWTAALTLPEGEAVFSLGETSCTVTAGGVTIPVSEAMLGGARRAAGLFSLREEALCGVEATSGGARARFRQDGAEITVDFGVDGRPTAMTVRAGGAEARYAVQFLQTESRGETS